MEKVLTKNWQEIMRIEPEAVVMPCRCGSMPAPYTNVAAVVERRCQRCYVDDWYHFMRTWEQ